MTFHDITSSRTAVSLIQFYVLFLMISGVSIFVNLVEIRCKKIYMLWCAVLTVFAYFAEQTLLRIPDSEEGMKDIELAIRWMLFDMPLWECILIVVCVSLSYVLLIYRMKVWSREHISFMSLKEAIDTLPDGLCYYDDRGITLSVNMTMNQISTALTGEPLSDGVGFLEKIKEGRDSEDCTFVRSGDEPIIRLSSGEIYSIVYRCLTEGSNSINEIIATDITEEYNAAERLNRQNERLNKQKERLKEFGKNVTGLTIEKELLQAKIDIHDNFGKALLAARQYIRTGDGDRDKILDIWNTNVILLEHERSSAGKDIYASVMKAASDVGVGISIKGRLPAEEPASDIVMTALRECVTNTFRHARGDRLYVDVDDKDSLEYIVTMTNNGMPPVRKIHPTGGLGNLMRAAKAAGADLIIESEPVFKLILKIPRIG